MIDATGKKIRIGEAYGYSRWQQGYCVVYLGRIVKFSKKGMVRLKIEVKIVDGDKEAVRDYESDKVYLQPGGLFPISEKLIDHRNDRRGEFPG